MHVVDHVEGHGCKSEDVETQCRWRNQNKLELISAGIQISGGKLHLAWVFKSLALTCYCSAILVWEKEEVGPHQIPRVGLALFPPPQAGPKAGSPAARGSRCDDVLLQISGVELHTPGSACAAPLPAWRGLQEALHGTELGHCSLPRSVFGCNANGEPHRLIHLPQGRSLEQDWTSQQRLPAVPSWDQSLRGALLSSVYFEQVLCGDGLTSYLAFLCLSIKERVWPFFSFKEPALR